MYKAFFKPLFDFSFSLLAICALSPVLLIVTVLLAIANKGKPFFIQKRPGKNEKIFHIVKFKTMTDSINASGELLPDAERLTTIGKIVRKSSIDEIPQLFNVLMGEMSLVGPRPLLPEYLVVYENWQKKRHHVKPGITGWAQINGRNFLNWDKKFALDVWYVENVSLWLDIKILFLTLKKVIISEGISAEGHETMPRLTDYMKKKNSI